MYNRNIHHRRSIRLKGYDYSQNGAYFITICTQNRECLFGDIKDGEPFLYDAGKMVQSVWNGFPDYYPYVELDQFIVMPNHIHGIIVLNVGAGLRACPELPEYNNNQKMNWPVNGQIHKEGRLQRGAPTLSLPDLVHRFKSFTTAEYRRGVDQFRWTPFPGKLWQRNYHDRIIRNDSELNRIRGYIVNNPLKWHLDKENPANSSDEKEKKFWGERAGTEACPYDR